MKGEEPRSIMYEKDELVSKQVLPFDVDGVLLHFSRGFRKYAMKEDHFLGDMIDENPFHYGFLNIKMPNYARNLVSVLIKEYVPIAHDLELKMECMPKILRKLMNVYDIHLISCATALPSKDRIANLERMGIHKGTHYLTYTTVKTGEEKVNLALSMGATALVEDKPSTIRYAVKKGLHVFAPSDRYVLSMDPFDDDKMTIRLHLYGEDAEEVFDKITRTIRRTAQKERFMNELERPKRIKSS